MSGMQRPDIDRFTKLIEEQGRLLKAEGAKQYKFVQLLGESGNDELADLYMNLLDLGIRRLETQTEISRLHMAAADAEVLDLMESTHRRERALKLIKALDRHNNALEEHIFALHAFINALPPLHLRRAIKALPAMPEFELELDPTDLLRTE